MKEFEQGETICNRYRILGRPFGGGIAYVYPAEDLVTHEKVALKMLQKTSNPEEVMRFEREADTHAKLVHPHIVRMLGRAVFSSAQNQSITICVLEWIDGGMSLESLFFQEGCSLPLPLVLSLMYQVADAIAYAHGQDLVHRDIKPSNVLLDLATDGELIAKVSDFGTVKLLSSGGIKMTHTGTTLGTPVYMSPEQGLGLDFAPTVDIYAFWSMLYELFTSRRPYMHKIKPEPTNFQQHWQAWHQIRNGEVTLEPVATFNPDVPESLQSMIARGLDPTPSSRPSMSEAVVFLKKLWTEINEGTAQTRYKLVVPSSFPPRHNPNAETLETPASLSGAVRRIAQAKIERRTMLGMGLTQPPKSGEIKRLRPKEVPVPAAIKPAKPPPSVRSAEAKPVSTPRPAERRSVGRAQPAPQRVQTPVRREAVRRLTPSQGRISTSEVVATASQAYANPIPISQPEPLPVHVPVVVTPLRNAVAHGEVPKKSNPVLPVLAFLILLGILGVLTSQMWLPIVQRNIATPTPGSVEPTASPVVTSEQTPVLVQPTVTTTAHVSPVAPPAQPTLQQPVVPSRPPPGKGRPRAGGVNDGFTVEGLPPGTPPPPDNP